MKFTEKKLISWKKAGNYENLIIALKEATFNIRKIAADFLGEFENESVISALIESVKDKATNVSDAAVQSLNTFNLSDEQKDLFNKILKVKQKQNIGSQEKRIKNYKDTIESKISKYSNTELLEKFKDSNESEIKIILENEINKRGGEAKLHELIIENYIEEISKFSNAELLNINDNSNEYQNDKFQNIVKDEILKRGGIIKLQEIVNKEKNERKLVTFKKKKIKIIKIILICFTPIFGYFFHLSGSKIIEKSLVEYRQTKYGDKIKDAESQIQSGKNFFAMGIADAKDMNDIIEAGQSNIRYCYRIAEEEFDKENNGILSKYRYIYPSIITIIYLVIVILIMNYILKKRIDLTN